MVWPKQLRKTALKASFPRVYSALIGQMTQSVVIGLLCSDWSDDPVCCDFVYSALIGQMTQSVVIGLLCSDWSDDPVCCDWSTLL